MDRFLLYAAMLYVIVFGLGMNFVLTGISLGLATQVAPFAFITLLPAIPIALYAIRSRSERLSNHPQLLRRIAMVCLVIAVAFMVVFVAPTIYI